ncbi:MAG: transcription-repair coupling factor [Proteobacteria bacterium]|nr:transcription-repair coupling factor [Pseudomonadota bacterium]
MVEEARTFRGDAARLVPPPGGQVSFCGLTPSSSAFVIAEILEHRPEVFLVYLPTPLEAEDFVRDLEFFWPQGASEGAILLCPGYEVKPFGGESPATDLVFARLWALYALLSGRRPLVVATSAPGALQLSMPGRALSETAELIESGQEADRDALLARLVSSGYYSTPMVQGMGDFSVRGGVLDLYAPGSTQPVRAEFFGDYIESLRRFRTSDQRSVEDLPEQIILPASEIVYSNGRAESVAVALKDLSTASGWLDLLWAPLVEKIGQGQFFPGLESFLPLFYDRLASIEDYAGPETIRVVFEPERLAEAGRAYRSRLDTHLDRIREEERPHLPLDRLYLRPEDWAASLSGRRLIEIRELDVQDPARPSRALNFPVESNQDLRALIERSRASAGLLAPLAARITAWLGRGIEVVLVCHTRDQARRMAELLESYQVYPRLDVDGRRRMTREGERFSLTVGFLTSGFVLPSFGRAYVTEDELFGPKRRVIRRAAEEVKRIHLSSFQDLAVGDFVVHTDFGIGQYLGLVTLEVEDRANDYLHLVYRGGDKLYVPVDRFGAVGKYLGADDRPPPLDKLGGLSWERVKARVKASIREMAEELLGLYARRQVNRGTAFSPRDEYFREFEASFDYEETPDQLAAIEEVLKDMASDKPMDRLVCGDVGYGKTEVALRAAFKAIEDHMQVAVLVPTTVLAEQHYQTFADRFKPYPIEVEVLSRFRTRSEQTDVLKRLLAGQVNVVIGTHRLLQSDVHFKNLGLLVVDEEHRFGVTHKERIKKKRAEVDVLTLTATPIPRTLQMSLTGIRDLSTIETPPQDRQAIKTYLLKYDEPTICEAIARELDRGGQVFFVHNRVRDIDMVAARLKRLMPMLRLGVAHGQQKERELEKVMIRFVRREIDVLVTTTIIESGLDFPTANTIIINNADRFGLAQIYQLRGRVGRSDAQAFAYLLVASEENLTRDARKRLRALLDFSELGAGFRIALHDLQIRGAGNLLGAAQSGQIAAVGYEMYVQLMERTIGELKGGEIEEEIEPEMVLGLPAYIPERFVPDTEQRLVHYRRLSSALNEEEIEEVATELRDRYGPLPRETENLLEVMAMKPVLKTLRVKKLELGQAGLTLSFTEKGPKSLDKVMDMIQNYKNKAKIYPDGKVFIPESGLSGLSGLKRVKNILHALR